MQPIGNSRDCPATILLLKTVKRITLSHCLALLIGLTANKMELLKNRRKWALNNSLMNLRKTVCCSPTRNSITRDLVLAGAAAAQPGAGGRVDMAQTILSSRSLMPKKCTISQWHLYLSIRTMAQNTGYLTVTLTRQNKKPFYTLSNTK